MTEIIDLSFLIDGCYNQELLLLCTYSVMLLMTCGCYFPQAIHLHFKQPGVGEVSHRSTGMFYWMY